MSQEYTVGEIITFFNKWFGKTEQPPAKGGMKLDAYAAVAAKCFSCVNSV